MRKIWAISLIFSSLIFVFWYSFSQEPNENKSRFFKGEYFSIKEVEVNNGGATVGFSYDYFMVIDKKEKIGKPFLVTSRPVDSLYISGLIVTIETSSKIYSFKNVLWDKRLKLPAAVVLKASNYVN